MSESAPVYAPLAGFRSRLKAGEAIEPGVVLMKQYVADQIKRAGGNERTYTLTISTGAIDRDRDTIATAGWDFSAFLKGGGGPVLYAHDRRGLPIGKAPYVKVEGSAVKARMEFAPAEANPLAESVRQLVDFGALKAASVGFRALKYAFNEERGGVDFMEQELLEFSIVPVPANAEALLDAKAAGVDVEPVRGWCERFLDALEPGIWIPKKGLIEAARAELAAPAVAVPASYDPEPTVTRAQAELEKRGLTLSDEAAKRMRDAEDPAEAVGAALEAALEQEKAPAPAPVAPMTRGEAIVAVVRAHVNEFVRHQSGAA